MKRLFLIFFLITTLSTAVLAQDSTASPNSAAADSGDGHGDYGRRAEVFITGFGLFPSRVSGNAIDQTGTEAAGGSAGYRFRLNESSALEGRYGFSKNSQKYTIGSTVSSIPVYLSEISGSYVYSFAKSRHVQPFLEGGGGLILFSPSNYNGTAANAGIPANTTNDPVYGGSSAGLGRQAKGMFLYGGGVDLPVLSHLNFRVEFRGMGYKTPDFGLVPLQTNAFSFIYEPSAGVAFRF
jgi:opacity protein-like surface antigen